MKQILILRHAKSSRDDKSLSDFDRPLAGRGREDASLMGDFVRKIDSLPDLIYSSPAQRARQTTELFCKAATVQKDKITWNERLYYGSDRDYIKVLRNCDNSNIEIIMLTGHNPLVENTVSLLYCNGKKNLLRMPTAALVCLEYPAANWNSIGENKARLKWMVIPRLLKKI